jgi:prepilin-type N-terminal cleavage/methylation domain-containing protein
MRGFTIIELLVVVLITAVIMTLLLLIMNVGQRSWFTGDVAIELRDQAVRAVTTMNKEISATRPSKTDLTIGETDNSFTFYLPHDNDGDGSVVDSDGNIEWSAAVTYSLNALNQIIRSQEGVNSVLGTNIASLEFTRTSDRIIQVDILVIKTPNMGERLEDVEQSVIKMRN